MNAPFARWSQGLAVVRRFAVELRPQLFRLLPITFLSLATAILGLLRPWPIQWIFDGALVPVADDPLPFATVVWTGVAAAVLIALGHALAQYVREISLAKVRHQLTRGLRYRVFAHLTQLSPTFHAEHKSGDLLVRLMGDVTMVSTMLVGSTVELSSRLLVIVATAAVMLYLDPLLSLAVLGILPVLIFVTRRISRGITVAVRKQRRKEGALADFAHEALAASTVVQTLGGTGEVARRFGRSNRRSERAGLRAKRLAARLSATVESLLGVALASTLLLGSFRVAYGYLTPGELLVFLSYLRSLLKPIRAASRHAERIAKGTACGERLLAVLDSRIEVTSLPEAPPAPAAPRELAFDRVDFTYADGTRALDGFSTRFRRGELVALVGRSGAGKSTVAALASRLFDPESGAVRLDGVPLCELELESVRRRLGLTMQRTVLFGESIRENLLLACPEASDEELWQACREAGAEGFLRRLPEGLDTCLGAAGAGLSGGQQSRLSLARTLLLDAPILIVDEPFAGLDRAAVHRVRRTLQQLARERIVVVVAHDLEGLEELDRIVLMDRGRVVGEGSHARLFQRFPLYRQMVRTPAEEVA